MGTNYYVEENKCECCGRGHVTHIGKSSTGWSFSFYGYENLRSWDDWKKYLIEKNIEDEYGNTIAYDDFVHMIETYKSPGWKFPDGRKNLQHNEELRKHHHLSENSQNNWDDDKGYAFCGYDFS